MYSTKIFNMRSSMRMACMDVQHTEQRDILRMFCRTVLIPFMCPAACYYYNRLLICYNWKITCPSYPNPMSSPRHDTRGVQGGSACVKEAYGYFF